MRARLTNGWRTLALAVVAALMAACEDGGGAVPATQYGQPGRCSALDDQLQIHHLQMLGTHNSYHVAKDPPLSTLWAYTHSPLDVQLNHEGVRAFEFDLHHKGAGQPIVVQHIQELDDGTRCPTLTDCLKQLKQWSDAHPCHHPLVATLESKDDLEESQIAAHLDQFEQEVLSVWPADRLVKPDDLRQGAPNLQAALAKQQWPTLRQSRGKLLLILYDKAGLFANYRKLHPGLQAAVAFVFGQQGDPDTAAVLLDNPTDPAIGPAVQAGYLVRTFPDSNAAEAEAAVKSGATVVSTDEPVEKPRVPGFALQLPGGAPSRCNPLTAPKDCTVEAVNAGVGSAP